MKTIIKKTLSLALLSIFIFASCDNDDGNAPNANSCSFQGLSVEDSNNNTIILISDADLKTEYFPNNNGPGIAAIEIFDSTFTGGLTTITTRALTVGAVDSNPGIVIQNVRYFGTVTNQRIDGFSVGDELRFDVIINGLGEAELCVKIDTVN
ncbi:MAG: hypothetical protein CVU07_14280, partial [Bacteroidetes bacterium HGW-Bacteroidetes-23]